MTPRSRQGQARNAWKPLRSKDLPNLRERQLQLVQDPRYGRNIAEAITLGKASHYMPQIHGVRSETELHREQARVLGAIEASCLTEATPTWHAAGDMPSLALTLSKTAPVERASPRRLPSETGFIVFDEPIGGQTATIEEMVGGIWDLARKDLVISVPVVAASWTTWKADGSGHGVRWHRGSPYGVGVPVDSATEGVWIHFYTASRDLWGELDDNEPLWTGTDGSVVTVAHVRDVASRGISPELEMHSDLVVPWGSRLPATPRPDTRQEWLNVLYTSWQLMSQRKKDTGGKAPLVQIEQLPPLDARRDVELGVRVVRVHPDHRPSQAAVAQDAAASTGRHASSCEYRWKVPPHRRSVCHNPALHREDPDSCRKTSHFDAIVTPHENGPIGKPLRSRPTVRRWDQQPDDTV